MSASSALSLLPLRRICLLLVAGAIFSPAAVQAQRSSSAQKAQQNASAAAKQVSADVQQLHAAEKAALAAMQKVKDAIKAEETARETATHRLERSQNYGRLHDQTEDAERRLADASKPVLEALRKTPAWKAASERALAAEARLKQLREDRSLSDEEKSRLQFQTGMDVMAADHLEKEELATNPATKDLVETAHNLRHQTADLRHDINEQVDADKTVQEATKAVDQAHSEYRTAHDQVVLMQRKTKMDAKIAAWEQQQANQLAALNRLYRIRRYGVRYYRPYVRRY